MMHHYCQNIALGSLEIAVELYKLLGFDVVYTAPEGDWVMVGQPQLRFAIQVTQMDAEPIADLEVKNRTHVALLSDNPKAVVGKVEEWAKGKGLAFRGGGWNDNELYFDLPTIFVNFVIEVLHSSIDPEIASS